MNLPKIERDNDTLWLLQDLSGMGVYDKAKAIVNFCDKETKLFEKEIDKAILEIFERNGINIPSTDKSVLKKAFEWLKDNGKTISITDLFKDSNNDSCELIKETKNHFVVMLETEYICGIKKEILQCGVEVSEEEYEKLKGQGMVERWEN